ncbi:hypothetical protein V6N12_047754 [Hibiscus sabdariffa]|uniref:beta-galactosidase n=1 Tax=Hibiscus sabdariffa TaxID=183260 RepID=A0ABR2CTX2_9ROSI
MFPLELKELETYLVHYHGGTSFGRISDGFVATSYDHDAPIDGYGMVRKQKWSCLRGLHTSIKLCEPVHMKACVFKLRPGTRAAFLANFDTKNSVIVMHCDLTLWSISRQYSSCFHQWSIIREIYGTMRMAGHRPQVLSGKKVRSVFVYVCLQYLSFSNGSPFKTKDQSKSDGK